MALQGKDLRKLVVREVMSNHCPQVPRTAPVERVTYILSHETPRCSWKWATHASRSLQVRFDEHRRIAHGFQALTLTRELQ